MKKLIVVIATLLLAVTMNAQSPVGKWKLVSGTTENVAGKSEEIFKEAYQKEPCLKDVVYQFNTDGKITLNSDGCPEESKKSLEELSPAVKWELVGTNRIKLSTNDPDIDPQTYNLTITRRGDGKRIMTWVMTFPGGGHPESIRKLSYSYHEL